MNLTQRVKIKLSTKCYILYTPLRHQSSYKILNYIIEHLHIAYIL